MIVPSNPTAHKLFIWRLWRGISVHVGKRGTGLLSQRTCVTYDRRLLSLDTSSIVLFFSSHSCRYSLVTVILLTAMQYNNFLFELSSNLSADLSVENPVILYNVKPGGGSPRIIAAKGKKPVAYFCTYSTRTSPAACLGLVTLMLHHVTLAFRHNPRVLSLNLPIRLGVTSLRRQLLKSLERAWRNEKIPYKLRSVINQQI